MVMKILLTESQYKKLLREMKYSKLIDALLDKMNEEGLTYDDLSDEDKELLDNADNPNYVHKSDIIAKIEHLLNDSVDGFRIDKIRKVIPNWELKHNYGGELYDFNYVKNPDSVNWTISDNGFVKSYVNGLIHLDKASLEKLLDAFIQVNLFYEGNDEDDKGYFNRK